MSNASKAKTAAVLTAQCAAYKEGIATFRAFLAKHQFEARNAHGLAIRCLSANHVAMMLDCIVADVEQAGASACSLQKEGEASNKAMA